MHINQTKTLQLLTNPLRHIYCGSLDKGLNFQSIRFGRSINGNETVLLDRRNSQQNHGFNLNWVQSCTYNHLEEYFSGPGFILPEMLTNDNNMTEDGGTRSRSSLCGNVSNYNEGESDAEEAKHLGEGGQRAEEETELVEELPGTSALLQTLPKKSVQKVQKKPVEIQTNRIGVKRRLQDSEDGYIR